MNICLKLPAALLLFLIRFSPFLSAQEQGDRFKLYPLNLLTGEIKLGFEKQIFPGVSLDFSLGTHPLKMAGQWGPGNGCPRIVVLQANAIPSAGIRFYVKPGSVANSRILIQPSVFARFSRIGQRVVDADGDCDDDTGADNASVQTNTSAFGTKFLLGGVFNLDKKNSVEISFGAGYSWGKINDNLLSAGPAYAIADHRSIQSITIHATLAWCLPL